MSTVPSAITNRAPEAARQSRPKKDLSGLMPYLRRYPFGIFIGLFMAVLMSFIGNALPLATGVMTDTLAGTAVPFEHTMKAGVPATPVLNPATLSRSIPFYAPHTRRTLAIYSLLGLLCVALIDLL